MVLVLLVVLANERARVRVMVAREVRGQLDAAGVEQQGRLLLRVSQQLEKLQAGAAGTIRGAMDADLQENVPQRRDLAAVDTRDVDVGALPRRGGSGTARAASLPCVINPSVHYELTGQHSPECPVDPPPSLSLVWPQRAYVLVLPGREAEYEARRPWLLRQELLLELFPAVDGRQVFKR